MFGRAFLLGLAESNVYPIFLSKEGETKYYRCDKRGTACPESYREAKK